MSWDSQITVEVLDRDWLLEWSFSPKIWQSFVEAGEDVGLYMPSSCCAGACFTCACRIVSGQEDVDIGLISVPLVDINADQVLTCVGWLREEIFSDGKFHKIVLQKLV